MITSHFARCFRYDTWANRRIVDALKQTPRLEDRPQQIMAHLLISQKVWLRRLRGEDDSVDSVRPFWPQVSFEQMLDESDKGYQQLLASLPAEQLEEAIAYRMRTGVEYRTPIADILTQVLLHGSYHRGQLAVAIKQQGGDPPMTDYVIFTRES